MALNVATANDVSNEATTSAVGTFSDVPRHPDDVR